MPELRSSFSWRVPVCLSPWLHPSQGSGLKFSSASVKPWPSRQSKLNGLDKGSVHSTSFHIVLVLLVSF